MTIFIVDTDLTADEMHEIFHNFKELTPEEDSLIIKTFHANSSASGRNVLLTFKTPKEAFEFQDNLDKGVYIKHDLKIETEEWIQLKVLNEYRRRIEEQEKRIQVSEKIAKKVSKHGNRRI